MAKDRSTYSSLLFEQTGAIATIRLNRPDAFNALTIELGQEMSEALVRCRDDESVRVVVLTGVGRAFCAGGDVKFMSSLLDGDPEAGLTALIKAIHESVKIIRSIPKPVIAAINGVAAGAGFNLALACDYRLAVDSARFNQAFVRLGLSPDSGGTFFLPRLIGMARATELIMTGDFLTAPEALALGLLNEIVDAAELDAATSKAAERFAQAPTAALGCMKHLINHSLGISVEDQLNAELETQLNLVRNTEDFREGLTAFVEKRTALFQGR